MRDIILRDLLPHMATASLLALLSLLTWLGWRSKRGSALHRMRLWVLTALVMLSGGAIAGCSDQSQPNTAVDGANQNQGGGVTDTNAVPTCYDTMPTCYAPMEPTMPDPPPPPPTCYAPMVAPTSDAQPPGQVTPPTNTNNNGEAQPPQPQPMCYAPRRIDPPGSDGPQPPEATPPDAGAGRPDRPQRMCYAPRRMPDRES